VKLSTQYNQLVSRIEELRTIFLPTPFDPTGIYPAEQATRTLGFRLLVHAEIESFLEERARDLARAALDAWEKRNQSIKSSRTITA
jgi:hypothetical protein